MYSSREAKSWASGNAAATPTTQTYGKTTDSADRKGLSTSSQPKKGRFSFSRHILNPQHLLSVAATQMLPTKIKEEK
jgi:hypothetical protein